MKIRKFSILLAFTICWTFALFNSCLVQRTWYFEKVSDDCDSGNTSIVLERHGKPHISYISYMRSWVNEYPVDSRYIMYAYFDCSWHAKRVATHGGYASLALDRNGNPHISYLTGDCILYDWPIFDGWCSMDYDYYDGSSWHSISIEDRWGADCGCPGPSNVSPPLLCLDSNDKPHISYTIGGMLYYSYYNGDWFSEVVDNSNERSYRTSIALDSGNNPHISYLDSNVNLKYAHFDGIWHSEVVDIEECGQVSLIIDSNDNPHISYHDFTNGSLKYAHCDGSSWHVETVDNGGDIGYFNSLAIDSNNHPHISYHDNTNRDLKYAHFDGNSWHIETVDNEGDVGRGNSLALDSQNNPHIIYLDRTNRTLMYARLAYFPKRF